MFHIISVFLHNDSRNYLFLKHHSFNQERSNNMENRIDRRKLLQLGTVAAAFGMASVPVSAADHAANPVVKLTWIGASTMVIEFNGQTILTDPCFGEGDEAFIMGDPNKKIGRASCRERVSSPV